MLADAGVLDYERSLTSFRLQERRDAAPSAMPPRMTRL